MQLLMSSIRKAAPTSDLRTAIETLQRALLDPDADADLVEAAHTTIKNAQASSAPIVARWITDYLHGIASGTGVNDVQQAVVDLARNFKLPSPDTPPRIGEQGTLF